jgi:aminoglycoside phosphotransferase (APT) family kinase protein
VLPEAADSPIDLQSRAIDVPSRHRHGMAFVGDYVVKFAWSRAASHLVLDQARLLAALGALSIAVPVPIVVCPDPPLLIYRKMPGHPLPWTARKAADSIVVERIGRQLGEILAHLHAPEVLLRLERAGITLPPPLPQSTPDRLRGSMFPLLDSARMEQAERLVAIVEEILAAPSPTTFLHGDFHGHNLLISDDGLQVLGLVDFEESAAGDPAYDLRYLPALAPTLDLLSAAMESYAVASGRSLDRRRVLAWHVLTDLGDALWRTEQGVEVVDGPLARRFDDLLICLDLAGWRVE